MGHGHSGGRLNAEKAAFVHKGEADPGALSASSSPKLDEMQELTDTKKCHEQLETDRDQELQALGTSRVREELLPSIRTSRTCPSQEESTRYETRSANLPGKAQKKFMSRSQNPGKSQLGAKNH